MKIQDRILLGALAVALSIDVWRGGSWAALAAVNAFVIGATYAGARR